MITSDTFVLPLQFLNPIGRLLPVHAVGTVETIDDNKHAAVVHEAGSTKLGEKYKLQGNEWFKHNEWHKVFLH